MKKTLSNKTNDSLFNYDLNWFDVNNSEVDDVNMLSTKDPKDCSLSEIRKAMYKRWCLSKLHNSCGE